MATEYVPLEAVKAVVCETCEKPSCPELWGGDCSLMGLLNDLPAADVVEVVRCKDCVHNCGEGFVGGTIACGLSNLFTAGKDPMDFCSLGERRTE